MSGSCLGSPATAAMSMMVRLLTTYICGNMSRRDRWRCTGIVSTRTRTGLPGLPPTCGSSYMISMKWRITLLATTWADSNGYYIATFTNNDLDENAGVDLRIKFYSTDDYSVNVRSGGAGNSLYFAETPTSNPTSRTGPTTKAPGW